MISTLYRVGCVCGRFFFNDTATTEIYTLSLHDALPIYRVAAERIASAWGPARIAARRAARPGRRARAARSEEHTSELQSRQYLLCRLLLEKKKHLKLLIFPFHPLLLPALSPYSLSPYVA